MIIFAFCAIFWQCLLGCGIWVEMALMSHLVEDRQLLQAARAGDRAAFGAWVRRHEAAVFSLLCAQLRDAEAAREVAQRTFVRAFEHVDAYLAAQDIAAYLLQAARNAGREYQRSESRRHNRDRTCAQWRIECAPDEHTSADEAAQLTAALGALDDEARHIVLLHLREELTFKAVAELTGIPERTVYRRYDEALQALRRQLKGLA